MKTTLRDHESGQRTINVEVKDEQAGLGLVVCPQGYGCHGCDDAGPLYLEVHEGRLRLLVWGDINQEDPTHIIDLEDARDDRRRDG